MYTKSEDPSRRRPFDSRLAVGSFVFAPIIVTLFFPCVAQATMVNLTLPNSGGSVGTFYGTAIFTTDTTQPTGTGVFDPFLTIQNTGVEEGYNSSAKNAPFDVKRIPQWNHEFTVAEMKQNALFYVGTQPYYRFLIDVNEPNALNSTDNKPLISLDSLQLYTSSTAGKTTKNLLNLGTKRFDLDLDPLGATVDNWVLYDDRNHGSGEADIAFLIPASAFAGAADTDFVYMYQKFGEHASADLTFDGSTEGGFEETRFGGFVVPEASTAGPLAAMLLMASCGECFRRRRRAVAQE
jgi:hypothetical protein